MIKPIKKPVDNGTVLFSQLEAGLSIDPHNLNDALAEQPTLFYHVAKQLALEISRRDAAKQTLAEVEASADQGIRDHAETNEFKLTEKDVESQKRLDPNVQQCIKVLADLEYRTRRLTALKDAFQERGYALKGLVDLYSISYYAESTGPSKQLKNVQAELTMQEIARTRSKLKSTSK